MLSVEFFEQNFHFALSLFAALVFFAVFWLYFDAWMAENSKTLRDGLKWSGFLLVSISFVVYATLVEQSGFGQSIFGNAAAVISNIVRLVGYVAIAIGLFLDPLQERPDTKGIEERLEAQDANMPATKPLASVAFLGITNGFGTVFALPLSVLAITFFYWRRATTGIERHLGPVTYAFLFLFGFEALSLSELLRTTSDPTLFNLVKAFGPTWITAHILLLVGVLLLGRWVWRYLTERFLSQMFMILTSTVLAIFLLTTVSFTFLLLRSIQNDALNNLATATSVLGYALNSKKAETEANAESVASNAQVVQAITAKDHTTLNNLTSSFLENKGESSLIITTAEAQVLLRAEDPEHWGDSISSDTLVRRALIGTNTSTVTSTDGVLAPVVSIRSIVPVRNSSGTIIGTVSAAVIVDNAFVDGIKHSTGLDSSVYSSNIRSATTLTTADGTTRWTGVKETSRDVQNTVLKQGNTFKGALSILNRQYLAVYAPLKDADNVVIGMLFIGQPEIAILQTASYLISLTFVVAVVLLALAVIPAYLLARHIAKQLE